jgi:hypothetical protein
MLSKSEGSHPLAFFQKREVRTVVPRLVLFVVSTNKPKL